MASGFSDLATESVKEGAGSGGVIKAAALGRCLIDTQWK